MSFSHSVCVGILSEGIFVGISVLSEGNFVGMLSEGIL